MQNASLDEGQSRVKIARNINNLRYIDDITLMVESKEELKRLLMKVKEESKKVGLKLSFWCMLRFDRKKQNSVKQLSFNLKIN